MRNVADDTPDERENHPRTFDQQERMQLLFRHAFDVENAHIFQLQNEQNFICGLVARVDGQFDHHFILMLYAALLGIEIDRHLHIRLHLTPSAPLCKHILKGHIADELR